MAAKYWVGGTGTWSTAGRWSTSTGQASFVATRPLGANATLTVTQVYSGTITSGHALYDGAGTARGVINQQLTPLLGGETSGGVGRYSTTAASAAISTNNQCYTIVNGATTPAPASGNTDEIIFDANSGRNPTVTVSVTSYAGNLYIGNVGTTPGAVVTSSINGTLTLTGTSTLTLYGDMRLPTTGLNWTHTGILNITGTNTRTFTSNGSIITSAVTINITTTTNILKLADSFTTTGTCTFTLGTLDFTNAGASTGVYFTCSALSTSGTSVKYYTMGTTGKLCLSGTGVILTIGTTTNYILRDTGGKRLSILILDIGINSCTINANGTSIETEISAGSGVVNIYTYISAGGGISLIAPTFTGTVTYIPLDAGGTQYPYFTYLEYHVPLCVVTGLPTPTTLLYLRPLRRSIKINPTEINKIFNGVTPLEFGFLSGSPYNAYLDLSNISGELVISRIYCDFYAGYTGTINFGNSATLVLTAGSSVIDSTYFLGTPKIIADTRQNYVHLSTNNLTNILPDVKVIGQNDFGAGVLDTCGGPSGILYVNQLDLSSFTGTVVSHYDSFQTAKSFELPSAVKTVSQGSGGLRIRFINSTNVTVKNSSTVGGYFEFLELYGTGTVDILSDIVPVTVTNRSSPQVTLFFNSGTLNTNNYTVNFSSGISLLSSLPKTLNLGSSNVTIAGTSGGLGYGSLPTQAALDSLTLNSGTSTVKIISDLYNLTTTNLYNYSWYNIVLAAANNISTCVLIGNGCTVQNFTNALPSGYTGYTNYRFSGTFNFKNFSLAGTSAYPLKIDNTGYTCTLNSLSSNPFISDYLSLTNLNVTPSNKWYATNSIDNGNNTGWNFNAPPSITYNSTFFNFF